MLPINIEIPYTLANTSRIYLVSFALFYIVSTKHNMLKYGINVEAALANAIPLLVSQLSFISECPINF
jgi:hypothetical protein